MFHCAPADDQVVCLCVNDRMLTVSLVKDSFFVLVLLVLENCTSVTFI